MGIERLGIELLSPGDCIDGCSGIAGEECVVLLSFLDTGVQVGIECFFGLYMTAIPVFVGGESRGLVESADGGEFRRVCRVPCLVLVAECREGQFIPEALKTDKGMLEDVSKNRSNFLVAQVIRARMVWKTRAWVSSL
jgi:hypothetical protein